VARHRVAWRFLALAGCLGGPWAQTGRAAEVIPLTSVNGAIGAEAPLRTEKAEVPPYVVVDLGARGSLLVHYPAAAQLRLLQVGAAPGAVHRVAEGPEAPGSPRPEMKATALEYTAAAYGYWLEADGPDRTATGKLRVRLATSEFDTRVDAGTAKRPDRLGGNLNRLMLGGVDVTRYAVLRPSGLSRFPEPRPDVILGTGFLSHFLVTIDPDQQHVTLVPTREPQLALAEREFFVACAQADPAGIEAFLQAYPESRLLPEAS
jgi:hypothetical protein